MSQRGQPLERRGGRGSRWRGRERGTRRTGWVYGRSSLMNNNPTAPKGGREGSIARRRRSPLSLPDRTLSWRRPDPGSAQTQQKQAGH